MNTPSKPHTPGSQAFKPSQPSDTIADTALGAIDSVKNTVGDAVVSSRSFFEGLLRTPFDGLIGLIFGWVDRGPDAIEHAAVLAAVKDATRR